MLLLAYITLVIFGMVIETAVLMIAHKQHIRRYMAEGMAEKQAREIFLQKEFSML